MTNIKIEKEYIINKSIENIFSVISNTYDRSDTKNEIINIFFSIFSERKNFLLGRYVKIVNKYMQLFNKLSFYYQYILGLELIDICNKILIKAILIYNILYSKFFFDEIYDFRIQNLNELIARNDNQEENENCEYRKVSFDNEMVNYIPIECEYYCKRLVDIYVLEKFDEKKLTKREYKNIYNHFKGICIYSHSYKEIFLHQMNISNNNNKSNIVNSIELSIGKKTYSRILNYICLLNSKPHLQIKTVKCKNGLKCNKLPFCFDYHNKYERRRPISTENKICDKVFNGKWMNPELCPNDDLCSFFHTKNEMLYDNRNYRKKEKCEKEDKEGYCDRGIYCYFMHFNNINIRDIVNSINNQTNSHSQTNTDNPFNMGEFLYTIKNNLYKDK